MHRCAFLLGSAIVLAGCGSSPAAPSRPQVTAPDAYVTSPELCGKPAGVPELPAQQSAIPADFEVSWVLECAVGPPALAGKPENEVRRADTPAAELVAALRRPSATERSSPCTTEFLLPFYLVLVTEDGRTIAPVIPVDGCAKPQREVLAAMGRLPFRVIS